MTVPSDISRQMEDGVYTTFLRSLINKVYELSLCLVAIVLI